MACDRLLSNREMSLHIPTRHIIGAAYMAVEKQPADDTFTRMISQQMNATITARAPRGQLGLRTKQSIQYLQTLADLYLESTV